MKPTTANDRMMQHSRLMELPMEKEADRLLVLAGDPERASLSNVLSLAIWAANLVGERDLADLLVRLESHAGPEPVLREVLGPDNPLPMLQELGPQEAGEQLMMLAETRLLG